MIVDYHMHLRDPEERIEHTVEAVERYVEKAGERRIDEVGFSEHVYYFMEGEGLLTLDGEPRMVTPGVVAWIPPGVRHQLESTGVGNLPRFESRLKMPSKRSERDSNKGAPGGGSRGGSESQATGARRASSPPLSPRRARRRTRAGRSR